MKHPKFVIPFIFAMTILTIFIASCSKSNVTLEKPFVIVGKEKNDKKCGTLNMEFTYVDANGEEEKFCELPQRYAVGDTIH